MDENDRSQEYIWIGDFPDRNLGELVFTELKVRRYGELALVAEINLKKAGFDDNQQAEITSMLAIRGLQSLGVEKN